MNKEYYQTCEQDEWQKEQENDPGYAEWAQSLEEQEQETLGVRVARYREANTELKKRIDERETRPGDLLRQQKEDYTAKPIPPQEIDK